MSERKSRATMFEVTSERGQEPSLATATSKGVPRRSPARQGQERKR
jgi:hypothetical protein